MLQLNKTILVAIVKKKLDLLCACSPMTILSDLKKGH